MELGIAVTDGLVQDQRLRDALQLEGTNLDETESARREVKQDVLPNEDLIRPGLRGDPSRDVDRPPKVIALVVDHRSRVHADVGGRQACGMDGVHDLERGHHRVAWISEMEVHAVAEHLHDRTSMPRCDLVDQLGKLERDARRLRVPGLFGQPRVTGEVCEHAAFDLPRFFPMDPRVLERGLDMIEEVLGLEHL
jgi:hypothetical protein